MTRIKITRCLTCGREVEYQTKRPVFCRRCYGVRRYARAIGRDTSAPLVQTGFQPGNVPWNRGLGLEDPRVASYAAKLRLIERAPAQGERHIGTATGMERPDQGERRRANGDDLGPAELRAGSIETDRPEYGPIGQPRVDVRPTPIRRDRRQHCRLCGTVREVGTHHLDLNPRNTSRKNRVPLCATCRGAVILLVGRDPALLKRLLIPATTRPATQAA